MDLIRLFTLHLLRIQDSYVSLTVNGRLERLFPVFSSQLNLKKFGLVSFLKLHAVLVG